MSSLLASLSDNFVYASTAVIALAMLAHAAEWAFRRERRTSGRAEQAATVSGETSGAATTAVESAAGDQPGAGESGGGVAVLEREQPSDGGGGVDRADLFARIGVALTILSAGLLGAGVLCRGFAAGRVPWSNLYEFSITGSFVIMVVYLVSLRKLRTNFLGLPLTGFVLVLLTVAISVLYVPVTGLIPALQSYWLAIHVSAACLATGIFTLGAVASALQIFKARYERRVASGARTPGGYFAQLPSAQAIDRVAYRLNAFAFPIWTFALIAGAVWAAAAWGRYWGWDPKETWMFITWVCYAAYLHARSTAGWRTKVSGIALVSYAALVFNLVGVNFFIAGLHSYAK
ncbi:c-type cytochrome biogenesis protein CcsB [Actinopolymorpha rutila]|uniref:Cytochrome c-type biogenesis protein CcsB n=1 Tax=Actinopolymorpha rutila TaxID=446787 RepID=A0A852ZT84_9ACTN|nr:cytochrome c-type biogenesis protein CcsB [Actinopolymorpha rutila]